MNRPKLLHVGGTLFWVLRTRNPDTQVLKDADSTPTVAIRKNGASTGDSVTVTKRSATTGIYDCSYNPAGEVEGDEFTVEETAVVTGTTTAQATYSTSWEFTVLAVERGTDNAALAATALSTSVWTSEKAGFVDAAISTRSTFAGGAVASVTGNVGGNVAGSVGSVTAAVTVGANNDKTGYSLTTAPPTAAAIADAVWDEARTGHTTVGTFGFYLDAAISDISAAETNVLAKLPESGRALSDENYTAPLTAAGTRSALGMAAADLDTQLDAIAAGSSGTGTGARTVTITVNDGSTVLQNARVRLSEGANEFTGLTNASGVVTFNVDDATYTVAITKSRYSYAGTTLVVDGTEAVMYSMTATSVSPPTEPSLSAVEVLCLSATFTAQSGIDIDFRLAAIPSGDQNRAMPGAKVTVTSDSSGIARWEAPQGATIEYKRGSTQVWAKVVLDNDSVTNVQSVIGSP